METWGRGWDEIDRIIVKYENHPSMIKIESKVNIVERSNFTPLTGYSFNKIVKFSSKIKKVQWWNTLAYLHPFWCISWLSKIDDATPVFKKGDTGNKLDYRPVTILPFLSKVFEKVVFNQISDYLKIFLAAYYVVCGNAMGVQHALFNLDVPIKK